MQTTFTLIAVFLLGTIIGSGINALDWRTGQNKNWLTDRSRCPYCSRQLSWWELIPLVSFFVLGRKCKGCGKPISWQYPLVELAAGLLFVVSVTTYGISAGGVFAAAISAIVLFIYVRDGRTMIIPDPAVWLFNGLALASVFVHTAGGGLSVVWPGWLPVLAGPLVAMPFVLIWLITAGRAMGFADSKLALGIGWLLGTAGGFSAVIFAFWIGAAVSLALLGWQRVWTDSSQETADQLTLKSAVPFGPFLILGFFLVFFGGFGLF